MSSISNDALSALRSAIAAQQRFSSTTNGNFSSAASGLSGVDGDVDGLDTSFTSSTAASAATTAGGSSFGSMLQNAVNGVEQMHSTAQQEVTELAMGDRQDIHNVMIAVEKADVAFQLMMQVRNKIVNAYQEVSKMQF